MLPVSRALLTLDGTPLFEHRGRVPLLWWCFFREEQLSDSGRLHTTLHDGADAFRAVASAAERDRYLSTFFAGFTDITVQEFHRSLRRGPDAVLALDSAAAGDMASGRAAADALQLWRLFRELPATANTGERLELLRPLLGDPAILCGEVPRDLATWRAAITAQVGPEEAAAADPALYGLMLLLGTPLIPESRRCFGSWGAALSESLRVHSAQTSRASRRDFLRRVIGG